MLDEYDKLLLKEAKEKINKVYEYNYGAPCASKELKKLETIIRKLNLLIEEVRP